MARIANLEQARCLFHNKYGRGLIDIARIASFEQARCLFHNKYGRGLINWKVPKFGLKIVLIWPVLLPS
ncbi:hypothetical protein CP500_000555 [Tychonema bourrellyi FEM_GT703]|uniref:Uncharacterized protein n=1 Tax=Tychonema bourrellyi FEM_GT703 TaxID=2040638 RepID=A0A2G4F6V9_9CYAN|nr:hypothetical protein CP500_000555 [Tychonema bourrellyi FEM_GT703]